MNIKTVSAAVLAGMLVAGCGQEKTAVMPVADEMAVSVDGKQLMQSAIDADVTKFIAAQGDKIKPEQVDSVKESVANELVQNFIVQNTLIAKAKADGFVVTDEDLKAREAEFLKATAKIPNAPKSIADYFKQFPLGEERARAEFENGILIDKMIKQELAKAGNKDFAAEAKKFVDNIASNNVAASAADAEALKKIGELKAQLDKLPAAAVLTNFAALAKANSACPSSAKGGDLGPFAHGQMVKEFDAAAFTLPVGKVSEPIKTQFGYHLILVTKKFPAVEAKDGKPAEPEKVQASHILIRGGDVQPLPKIENVIKRLEKQAEREFVGEFIQKQLKAAKIETSEKFRRFLPKTETPAADVVESDVKK